MFSELGLDGLGARAASAIIGGLIGGLFGIIAQRSNFCLRRALAGPDNDDRRSALAAWLTAVTVALIGSQILFASGVVDLAGHRYLQASLPLGGMIIGGGLFGAGMVLTRGCASRLMVLAGTGNLRAVVVMVIFSLVAFSTMKGLFSDIRLTLATYTSVDVSNFGLAQASLPALLGGKTIGLIFAMITGAVLLVIALRASRKVSMIATGGAIGLLVVLGWFTTGSLLVDAFDPIEKESIAFTLSMADSLFFFIASTAVKANFGIGLVVGVAAGAFLSALLRGELHLVGFDGPKQMLRYGLGAVLMGTGGVLAGGCTVGNGLTGFSTLGLAPMIGIASIIAGAKATDRLLRRREPMAEIYKVSIPAE